MGAKDPSNINVGEGGSIPSDTLNNVCFVAPKRPKIGGNFFCPNCLFAPPPKKNKKKLLLFYCCK